MSEKNSVHHFSTTPRRRMTLPVGWLAYFLWVPLAWLMLGAIGSAGLPHLFVMGEYQEWGGDRHYLSCAYVGPLGIQLHYPGSGACGWVMWVRWS